MIPRAFLRGRVVSCLLDSFIRRLSVFLSEPPRPPADAANVLRGLSASYGLKLTCLAAISMFRGVGWGCRERTRLFYFLWLLSCPYSCYNSSVCGYILTAGDVLPGEIHGRARECIIWIMIRSWHLLLILISGLFIRMLPAARSDIAKQII